MPVVGTPPDQMHFKMKNHSLDITFGHGIRKWWHFDYFTQRCRAMNKSQIVIRPSCATQDSVYEKQKRKKNIKNCVSPKWSTLFFFCLPSFVVHVGREESCSETPLVTRFKTPINLKLGIIMTEKKRERIR